MKPTAPTGPIIAPTSLPPPVTEKLQAVEEQVDQLVHGRSHDPAELQKDLRELCLETRQQRPLGVKTAGERKKALAVARVMAGAVRMATAAALAATPGAALQCNSGVALDELGRRLEADLLEAYATPTKPVDMPAAPADLIEWARIPAGRFLAGREKTPVELPDYSISRYPVTRAQYNEFLRATGYQPETDVAGSQPDGPLGDLPVAVGFWDARAFAQWVGGRLPNSQEWEKAFRPDGRRFPWGDEFDARRLNHDGAGPISVYEDERNGNVSPYGVVGGSGNVAGWVDDATPQKPGAPLMLGGSYGNYAQSKAVPFDVARHTSQMADSYYSGCGFWVVTDTPPTGEARPRNPATPHPAAPAVELPPALQEAEATIRHQAEQVAGGHPEELRPLKEQLRAVCKTVLEARPLTGADPDPKLQKSIAGVLSSASHVAVMATAVATGTPLAGAGLAACRDWLVDSVGQLEDRLKESQRLGLHQVQTVNFAPAQGDVGIQRVEVPAGEFLYGRDNEKRYLPGFQLSKYPVTNEQYARFVEETGYRPEGGWRIPAEGRGGEWEQHPATRLDYFDAKAFCHWAGGRLPSEPEWEKAARGTDGRRWPWGDEQILGRFNNELDGTRPVSYYEEKGNVSPYGVVGMVGDILEFTSTSSPERPGVVLTKGGGFHNFNLKPFDALRYTTEPFCAAHSALGFRVAWDQPGPSAPGAGPTLDYSGMSAELRGRVLSLTSLVREKSPFCTPALAHRIANLEGLLEKLDESHSAEVKAKMRFELYHLRQALIQAGGPDSTVSEALEKARNVALDNTWETGTRLSGNVWETTVGTVGAAGFGSQRTLGTREPGTEIRWESAPGSGDPGGSAVPLEPAIPTFLDAETSVFRPSASDLPNFDEVSPQLLRGGQPDREGAVWLQARGVRAVVDLRDEWDREHHFTPAAWETARYYPLTIPDMKSPTFQKVERFLELAADPENRPLFVHCKAGMGRTGAMVACWRITQGWTAEQAIEDEKRRSYAGDFNQEDFVRAFEAYWQARLQSTIF
ncbi:MAG: SUMF1/EgtB/PvdO family nonheme iron enzyme [Armatimonadetes bacterium]|nr:SUMF1/EgtB/PvdO family nonheme iron enzyme [Armatimonadota bacterium]